MASSWFLDGEELVVTLAPVAVYWVYSLIYELLLRRTTVLDKYRLHSAKDEETKNIVSRKDVVRGVLLQQVIQVAISVAVLKVCMHATKHLGSVFDYLMVVVD
jgi:sphinganine C4-monooxygenase